MKMSEGAKRIRGPCQIPKGGECFSSPRYRENAFHLGKMRKAAFNRTDVNEVVDELGSDHGNHKIIKAWFGDPTMYPGLHPYYGYHRFKVRYIHHVDPKEYAAYNMDGYHALKSRLREGRGRNTPGFIDVPTHVQVYVTPGVAGALRFVSEALLLPPLQALNCLMDFKKLPRGEHVLHKSGPEEKARKPTLRSIVHQLRRMAVPDNVVMPGWTYVSHMAEVYRCHGEVRGCNLARDGQVDLESMEKSIDRNTRAIVFATVGNPISVAMEPAVFDRILDIAEKKMREYGHPIVVIADTVYEFFRRDYSKRLDPVQRALMKDSNVPLIELSSFSKMMAIPGERAGFFRIMWDPKIFPEERGDFLKVITHLYWPSLGPVSHHVQRALGDLNMAIDSRLPVEEKLAPLAAVLCALKELPNLPFEKADDSPSIFTEKEIAARLRELDVPEDYFSAQKIASHARDLAAPALAAYKVHIQSEMVAEIAERLVEHHFLEAVERHGMRFYKLSVDIPPVKKDASGKLVLYEISKQPMWMDVAKLCHVETEDVLYHRHKEYMRKTVFDRVWYFAQQLDAMRNDGVYLHPAYYNLNGELDPDRFNAFYVMWGFQKLRRHNPNITQAAEFAEKCIQNGLPVVATVPGELFIPDEQRGATASYIRIVPLHDLATTDEILSIIRLVARSLGESTSQTMQMTLPISP